MLKRSFVPISFTLLMWAVFLLEHFTNIDLGIYGIYPRHLSGLVGIIAAPLLHGDRSHLLNNTFSFLILSLLFFHHYPRFATLVFVLIYILTGSLVWAVARGGVYHIGMSGVIYGLASFIFFSGLYRGNKAAIALSLLTALLYGSMVWGFSPEQKHISFESHICGAVVGILLAYLFRDIQTGNEEPVQHEENEELKKDFSDFLKQKQ
jgi:membrane associated rhomboid family serine protease